MDESPTFQQLLQQIQSAALHGTELPDNLHQQVTIADLNALNRHLGAYEVEVPEGALDHLDRSSIEWANASTIYRERFENEVFALAADKDLVGLEFLLETVLQPVPEGEDQLSWAYAKGNAMRWTGTCIANSDTPGKLLSYAVEQIQEQPERALPLMPELLMGISFWRGEVQEGTLEELLKLCQQAKPITQHHVDWDFAQIFRLQAPGLCRTVAAEQLERLEGKPMEAGLMDQLSFILSLRLFFPEKSLLQQSIAKTISLWLSNTHYIEGLYLLLSVWNHPHFAPAIEEVKQHLSCLQRIAQKELPEPAENHQTVDEIEQLRAHMLLSRLSDQPEPHRKFICEVSRKSSPQEQTYFEKWLEEN